MPFSLVMMTDMLLQVRGLTVRFGDHTVLQDISFELQAGETLGLVGESGAGKSTLARALLRLLPAERGTVSWRGQDLLTRSPRTLRALRRDLQIIFQNPLASLDPRMTVSESVAEPLQVFEPGIRAGAARARVLGMLERVGLDATMAQRFPHELSGGQCQRVGIARAMILRPGLLICDEPVGSLDVSIRGQIINLLSDLQRDHGTAMLFISHDLGLVRHLSHRILVMYRGTVVESASREALFSAPLHPYTRALLDAARGVRAANARPTATAECNGPSQQPVASCVFRSRCPVAVGVCAVMPALIELRAGHEVACHRAAEYAPAGQVS